METMGTKVELISSIKEQLAHINAEEVSLGEIHCKDGILLSISKEGVVKSVVVWKIHPIQLENISSYGLSMIRQRLNDVQFKIRMGFKN